MTAIAKLAIDETSSEQAESTLNSFDPEAIDELIEQIAEIINENLVREEEAGRNFSK